MTVRNLYPGFRVFVFGEEITEDVTSISVTHQDGFAPSTAEIVLVNAGRTQANEHDAIISSTGQDRYIITEEDIFALFPDVDVDIQLAHLKTKADDFVQTFSTLGASKQATQQALQPITNTIRETTAEAADHIDRIVRETISTKVRDPLKRRVLLDKFSVIQEIDQPSFDELGNITTTNNRSLRHLRGEAFRYPFQVGDCIFHTNDPVRVFFRDPENPSVWYHMFAGWVSDWTESVDENNTKTVTLRCEDVSRILRYARITTNPGIFNIDAQRQAQDAVYRTFFSNGFANLSLTEFLYLVVFGSAPLGAEVRKQLSLGAGQDIPGPQTFQYERVGRNGNSATTVQASFDATGAFDFDRSVIAILAIDGQEPTQGFNENLNKRVMTITSLPEYLALADHRMYLSDIDNMILWERRDEAEDLKSQITVGPDGQPVISDNRAETSDLITLLGTRPELFPVEGRLIMLLPQSLGPNTNRNILLKDLCTVATETTWTTRLALIYTLMERIEFSFYASPRGDLICEMPLYNFEPDDFGTEEVTLERLRHVPANALIIDKEEKRGPYQKDYLIDKASTIGWERSFSDEHVRTGMLCWPSIFQGYSQLGEALQLGSRLELTILSTLVPQFGVRTEICDPKGLIVSPEGAKLYTEIQLAKWNADARSANVRALPRPSICFPNRPIEFTARSFVGTLRSVTHSIVWNSGMETTYNVNYLRAWAGQRNSLGKPVYEALGGDASHPLNYKVLFNPRSVETSTKGRG